MKLTPAMRQYMDIKESHEDSILFFRMGDFYEMFFEDAVIASKVLEITLTSRNKGKEDSVPLCGVPYHAGPAYISKLIENGYKVAICEQVEDPKEARGIVKREVVRIVTPGLVVDPDSLSAKENNFLASISVNDNIFGLAFIDISTGEFWVTESEDKDLLINEIYGFDFKEIIVNDTLKSSSLIKNMSQTMNHNNIINFFPSDYFGSDSAINLLEDYFSEDVLSRINFETHAAMTEAAGAAFRYVKETQKERFEHINDIKLYSVNNHLMLDESAIRDLELFSTILDNKKEGSLFHTLDETVTAMGARRLRWWVKYPLKESGKIRERLAAVSEICEDHILRENLRKFLSGIYDLERLGSRISMGIANGRDIISLKKSLNLIPDIKKTIFELDAPLITLIHDGLDEMGDCVALIEESIVEDAPITVRDGGIIKEGYDTELDEIVSLSTDGKQWIALLEEKERKRTGISTLKVGFNNIFGYYIEVTKSNSDKVPDEYIRKQTLVNAERYINEELKKYEDTVLNAEERRKKREYELFAEIRDRIGKEIERIQKTASLLADLDTLASLAEAAETYNYCCPIMSDSDKIVIKEGRHPVVERMDLETGFVPNDIALNNKDNRLIIITGPNMAGKSTYIRQTALIVLMAQVGSFVPASEAHIGIVDKIFTRVGAGDNLARGQSTFMLEMTEVANILKNATSKSLILLDEVGRGTSTFDGLSIAWAVAEYINDIQHIGARTLFATHYHELTDLAKVRDGVKNFSVAVKEWGDQIIFLRNIVEGSTNRSYGIHVAGLAGVPDEVILRAREILANLEKGEFDEVGMPKVARSKKGTEKKRSAQLSLFIDENDRILNEMRGLELANMTPLDALNKINEWQKKINKD